MTYEEPTEQQQEEAKRMSEGAYRRGYTHGLEEMANLVLKLLELGYNHTACRRYLAVYDDHFIMPWRNEGDYTRREPPPPFQLEVIEEILAGTSGYDWIQ